jgi:general stress protein CsbA
MTQYNPYKGSFDQAKVFNKYAQIALWISTLLIIIAFSLKTYNTNWFAISDLVSNINCFFIISYATLTFISEVIFYQASVQRREDFIDNSFNTTIAEDRSVEYYTNENIANGIYKMAVNGFENSLFTFNIASKMTSKLWIKNIIFAILILAFAVFGYNNAFVLLIQMTLPILLLQQAIKQTLFVYRIKRVFENYRRMFNDLKANLDSKHKRPEIILNVLEYETTITYGAILLDSKIYEKLDPELSIKWTDLKHEYKIE